MSPKSEQPRFPGQLVGLRAIQSKRLYQQIAEQIKAYIAAGHLSVGDRLPPERELAQRFGVSRPSVREAMIALEGAGLIDVRTGDGTYVLSVNSTDRWIASGNEPGLLEQFEARRILEPELAARAAIRVGEAEIKVLRAAIDESARRFAAGELADDADRAFHVQLAAYSGNKMLADVIRELWDLRSNETWRVIRARIAQPVHRTQVIEFRRSILKAVERRESDNARYRMIALLDWATERYFGDNPDEV